tara:strand:+ start:3345 stop:5171 length:1827 start_codon:yes stop_codon:yes gene_type:complete
MTKTNITTLVDSILKNQIFGKDFKFRPNQRETVENICNHYLEDPNGTVVIDAPTGTGKSIIAMWCSYILKTLGNQGYIVTSDKTLQSQYEKDFMSYKLDWPSVKGVDNYECDVNGLPFSVGECKMRGYSHAQSESLPCAQTCDYLNARKKAINRSVTLLNYSFWLIQQNYVNRRLAQKQSEKDDGNSNIGGPMALNAELDLDRFDNFFPFKKRDFCFFDEAHKVDEIVQEHFSPFFKKISLFSTVTLIEFLVGEGIETPNISRSYMESLIQSILTEQSKDRMVFHLGKLKGLLGRVLTTRRDLQKRAKFKFGRGVDSKLPRKWKKAFGQLDMLKDIHCKVEDYLEIIEKEGLETMLWTQNLVDGEIKLMCLSESGMIKKHLHDRAGFKVFMSATIGEPKTFIKVMGIEKAKFIRLSNGFDYKKSPIIFVNRWKMSMSHKHKSLPKAIRMLDKILEKHKGHRGLIHTGSYEFSKYIKQHSNHIRRIIEYNKSSEKEEAILRFKNGVNGVIMGPSILEGLDFADETCRFQIFFKVPYPSLGDPLTKEKIKQSPGWYDWKTGITLQQGAGRSIRNENDWAVTYILDACFNNLINKSEFFPENFKQRIKKLK